MTHLQKQFSLICAPALHSFAAVNSQFDLKASTDSIWRDWSLRQAKKCQVLKPIANLSDWLALNRRFIYGGPACNNHNLSLPPERNLLFLAGPTLDILLLPLYSILSPNMGSLPMVMGTEHRGAENEQPLSLGQPPSKHRSRTRSRYTYTYTNPLTIPTKSLSNFQTRTTFRIPRYYRRFPAR